MKVSRTWLQTFFDSPLPEAQALADALTFHAFEIEGVENVRDRISNIADSVLDVKVTPNRGHDCLSHRGIAKELSAILNIPFKNDPFQNVRGRNSNMPKTDDVRVAISVALCSRYIAGYIHGVKVGPSPAWLRERLESVGQKSINNIVDAANYAMFHTGQPLHAFDAAKLAQKNGAYAITVRLAKSDERMLALDDKEYALGPNNLVIADGNADAVIGIAGVKGGKGSAVDEKTTDIILESANFDGATIRRTATALKLRTDASDRFQQVISPEMAARGMRAAADLIVEIAGGELVGFADQYPRRQEKRTVTVSLRKVNAVLGTKLTIGDITDVFKRLDFPYHYQGETLTVGVPFERLDLHPPAGGAEDLVEEIGRIIGYDKIPADELPTMRRTPDVNPNFAAAEKAREELTSQGYSEVYTSVFADSGERVVANKVDGARPYLRTSLLPGLEDALARNVRNKDLLVIAEVKLFEIGTAWKDGKEVVMVATVGEKEKASEKPLAPLAAQAYEKLPLSQTARYRPFSKYPFVVRDIALWVPAGTDSENVLATIRERADGSLVRSSLFDTFQKGEKTSYAFRLVFQSFEKTLTDAQVNAVMGDIVTALKKRGFEIR